MMGFGLWKRIKQRLRQGARPPAWRLAVLAAAVLSIAGAAPSIGRAAEAAPPTDKPGRSLIESLRSADSPLTVELRRMYLCGEEVQQLGERSAKEMIRMLQEHPEWTARLSDDGTVIVEETVNDLSPACKESAVFGIDSDGRLSLFDGAPEENRVLRTFYQLDVRHMESSLPKEQLDALQRGIRVSDVDELNSILSSFSDYAMPEHRKAMKPAPVSYRK